MTSGPLTNSRFDTESEGGKQKYINYILIQTNTMLYFTRTQILHLLEAVTRLLTVTSLTCGFLGKTPHCPVVAVESVAARHSAILLPQVSHQTPVCHLGNNPLLGGNMEVRLITSGETSLMTTMLCHLLLVSPILLQYGHHTMETRYAAYTH